MSQVLTHQATPSRQRQTAMLALVALPVLAFVLGFALGRTGRRSPGHHVVVSAIAPVGAARPASAARLDPLPSVPELVVPRPVHVRKPARHARRAGRPRAGVTTAAAQPLPQQPAAVPQQPAPAPIVAPPAPRPAPAPHPAPVQTFDSSG